MYQQHTFVPQATASSSFPLSKAVFDDSSSCLPSADEQAACCISILTCLVKEYRHKRLQFCVIVYYYLMHWNQADDICFAERMLRFHVKVPRNQLNANLQNIKNNILALDSARCKISLFSKAKFIKGKFYRCTQFFGPLSFKRISKL